MSSFQILWNDSASWPVLWRRPFFWLEPKTEPWKTGQLLLQLQLWPVFKEKILKNKPNVKKSSYKLICPLRWSVVRTEQNTSPSKRKEVKFFRNFLFTAKNCGLQRKSWSRSRSRHLNYLEPGQGGMAPQHCSWLHARFIHRDPEADELRKIVRSFRT